MRKVLIVASIIAGLAGLPVVEHVLAQEPMKEEVRKDPALGYEVATISSGTKIVPTLAVVFKFDPKTLKPKTTTIFSEKRAPKAWNEAHGIEI